MKQLTIVSEELSAVSLPTRLKEFIAWFQDREANIPESSRESAEVYLETAYRYSDGEEYVKLDLRYERLETDEEEQYREDKEAVLARRRRTLDLIELESLLAKYPEYAQKGST